MTNSEHSPADHPAHGNHAHDKSHPDKPAERHMAQQEPPQRPGFLAMLLNRRSKSDGEGNSNEWYERMRVRSLPEEEKNQDRDRPRNR